MQPPERFHSAETFGEGDDDPGWTKHDDLGSRVGDAADGVDESTFDERRAFHLKPETDEERCRSIEVGHGDPDMIERSESHSDSFTLHLVESIRACATKPEPFVEACHDFGIADALRDVTFEQFARDEGPRVRAALVASFGAQVGADAAAEALAYGWEHWARVESMDNRVGYLFRVGQNAARRMVKAPRMYPAPPPAELPSFDPGLLPALAALSDAQRVVVVLVHGFGWPIVEVAALLDVTHSTVRTHLSRALTHLQAALEDREHVV